MNDEAGNTMFLICTLHLNITLSNIVYKNYDELLGVLGTTEFVLVLWKICVILYKDLEISPQLMCLSIVSIVCSAVIKRLQ